MAIKSDFVFSSIVSPGMESRDLVSVSIPIFASLGPESLRSLLGLEVFRSRDFEYSKEMVY